MMISTVGVPAASLCERPTTCAHMTTTLRARYCFLDTRSTCGLPLIERAYVRAFAFQRHVTLLLGANGTVRSVMLGVAMAELRANARPLISFVAANPLLRPAARRRATSVYMLWGAGRSPLRQYGAGLKNWSRSSYFLRFARAFCTLLSPPAWAKSAWYCGTR